MNAYFIGIDIGTQGARVVLLSTKGVVVDEKQENFLLSAGSREEQSPEMWWKTCTALLKKLVTTVRKEIDLKQIKAMAVTSTSGTVIPLDKHNNPLHKALMYSDKRAEEVVPFCKGEAEIFFKDGSGYTGFNASSGLCKMVWYEKYFPEKTAQIKKWMHAADYIAGKLCNEFGYSDYTNALKSGYDIFTKHWPEYLYEKLPLRREWLPKVLPSGTPIGHLSAELAEYLRLPQDIEVVTGMTDGCASQVASGAIKLGDWNTTIGTTMVIKGVTKDPVLDPQGRLYNHLHPEGYFMPGGAGNTGADWVSLAFKEDLKQLTATADDNIPSGKIAWPLQTKGERFPIMAPEARGFIEKGLSKEEQFVANMEGVAYLERYAYQMIRGLSGEKVKAIYTAGGGSKNAIWLKIRSNVLNLPIYKMKYISGAVGAAILAASQTSFKSLSEAAEALTIPEKIIKPDPELAGQYEILYQKFVNTLKEKEYI